MMAYKENYCAEAMYFMRTNDDTIINYENLQSFLIKNYKNVHKPQIYGNMFQKAAVARTIISKWFVSEEEFPDPYYPDFCAGWSCLYTKAAVHAVLQQTLINKYLWLDDVLFSGILAERGGIPRVNLPNLFLAEFKVKDYRNYLCKSSTKDFIAVHFHDLAKFMKKNRKIDCRQKNAVKNKL
uniref:Hexosyltransferase n=1 Tax=Panagrolaimus sp. JU765 TaxID=591449 RepID=A0AC34Q396_9BILA